MTRWIGTRTAHDGVFNPAGLGRPCAADRNTDGLMARGSILIEAEARPGRHPVNLLRFGALDPWPSGLTICLEADGTVRLMARQGERHLETALRTSLGARVQTVHITYVWDAPGRHGVLSVHAPDHGHLWQAEVLSPFPMSLRDARRIMADRTAARLDETVRFAAISDEICPIGPLPGLLGTAAIETPKGAVALRDLEPGDLVMTDDRRAVPVLWNVSATVPALGRFAPMTLRRPYMGLWDDLVLSRDQRVCLDGSEVEYLFGEERVSTAVRHLEARNSAGPTRPMPATITYHQVLLESHEIIQVNGAMVESFDGAAILDKPNWIGGSVLAQMPATDRPRAIGLAAPVLQGYEALTLLGVSIG